MADILNDAIAAADGHLKTAQVKLFEAQNALEMLKGIAKKMKEEIPLPVTIETNVVEPPPEKIGEFGFAAIGTGFALLVAFAVLCEFIRRNQWHVKCGILISTYWHKMRNLGSSYVNQVAATARSTPAPIRPADFARLQWPTIGVYFMSFAGIVSCAYILMVNPLFGQLLHKLSVFGLTAVCTGLILFISLILVTGFRRLPAISELRVIIDETLKNIVRQFWKLINKLKKDNSKYVKSEIKVSIENFSSLKESLKEMKSRKIERDDVKSFEAAIDTVQSIEEKLNMLNSENITDEDQQTIQNAVKKAATAVEKIKKIISNHYPVIHN